MKFKVGDKVSVKTWNEMLEDEQVHIDAGGNLSEKGTSYSFDTFMKRFCGRMAIILSVNEKNEIKLFFDEFEGVKFLFREWMLKAEEDTTTVYLVEKE